MLSKILELMFTNIISIEYDNYFYNMYLQIPYILYFPMEIFRFNYIYKCGNTYYYSKNNEIIIQDPIEKFKINNIDYTSKLEKYSFHIPLKFFKYKENINSINSIYIKTMLEELIVNNVDLNKSFYDLFSDL